LRGTSLVHSICPIPRASTNMADSKRPMRSATDIGSSFRTYLLTAPSSTADPESLHVILFCLWSTQGFEEPLSMWARGASGAVPVYREPRAPLSRGPAICAHGSCFESTKRYILRVAFLAFAVN